MTEDDKWKRRFLLFMMVRVCGLLLIGFGMTIAFTALVRPGGLRVGGAILVAIGTVVLALGPLWLRKSWSDTEQ